MMKSESHPIDTGVKLSGVYSASKVLLLLVVVVKVPLLGLSMMMYVMASLSPSVATREMEAGWPSVALIWIVPLMVGGLFAEGEKDEWSVSVRDKEIRQRIER